MLCLEDRRVGAMAWGIPSSPLHLFVFIYTTINIIILYLLITHSFVDICFVGIIYTIRTRKYIQMLLEGENVKRTQESGQWCFTWRAFAKVILSPFINIFSTMALNSFTIFIYRYTIDRSMRGKNVKSTCTKFKNEIKKIDSGFSSIMKEMNHWKYSCLKCQVQIS